MWLFFFSPSFVHICIATRECNLCTALHGYKRHMLFLVFLSRCYLQEFGNFGILITYFAAKSNAMNKIVS